MLARPLKENLVVQASYMHTYFNRDTASPPCYVSEGGIIYHKPDSGCEGSLSFRSPYHGDRYCKSTELMHVDLSNQYQSGHALNNSIVRNASDAGTILATGGGFLGVLNYPT